MAILLVDGSGAKIERVLLPLTPDLHLEVAVSRSAYHRMHPILHSLLSDLLHPMSRFHY